MDDEVRCPHCGQMTRASASFCTRCGRRRDEPPERPSPGASAPGTPSQAAHASEGLQAGARVAGWSPEPRTGRPKWIAPVIGIVVIGAILAVFLFLRSGDDSDPEGTGTTRTLEGRPLFASNRDGNWEIYVADDDGTNPENLTNDPSDDEPASPSPDGTKVAFRSNRDGSNQIYITSIEGGEATRVTDVGENFFPSWSPDGDQLIFTRDAGGITAVYVMDADGTNPERIVAEVSGHPGYSVVAEPWHSRPSFSPNGEEIAFEAERDGNADIFVLSRASGETTKITSDPATDRSPAWSPDGDLIAFMSDRDGNNEIYTATPDGSGSKRLTEDEADDSFPAFAGDDRYVLFESDRSGNSDIWIMDADGANPEALIESSGSDHIPQWVSDA